MQNTDGEVTHTLLRAAAYIKDNRLTPAGFDKNTASSDIAVVGAAAEDDDFNLGSDTITYRIDVGGAQGLTVEAELNYQSLSYGHLQNLFTDAGSTAQVDAFKTHFESARIRLENISRVTAAVTSGCDVTLDISPNQWNQVSVPCAPPANANTLADVFGDDLTGVYDTNWVVYRYNADNQRYIKLQPDSIVAPGVGYWIIDTKAESPSIDLPSGSTHAPVAQSSQCLSDNGCAALPLAPPKTGQNSGWNMPGHPFPTSVATNRSRVKTPTGPCADADACTLDEAVENQVLHNEVWHYDPVSGNYALISGATPLEPWMGFWAATLSNARNNPATLLVPAD